MYGTPNYDQKGKSNPISTTESNKAELYIKESALWSDGSSVDMSPIKKDLVKIKSNTQMKAEIEIVSKDDGTGGTKAANNREYSGNFIKNGVSANPPGAVADPSKRQMAITVGVNNFHSHPSGTKRVPGGTAVWIQPPSKQDIQVSKGTEYVFGMRKNTVYIYNRTGVLATIPITAF